ncbi:14179_t:CDS:2 [Funneliformis geosporum]|nr:14179_t:CDS:2 [Funneliformis geosporum]
MKFFEFFDEYKKRVPEATPEQINEAFKISDEHQEPRKRKLKNSVISTEGPIFHYSGRLVLPIHERDIFNIVYSGVQEEKSFVIHGLYQCGKTSFLIALEEMLRDLNVTRFDMTDVKGHINQYGTQAGFFRYLSRHLFRETVDELHFNECLDGLKDRTFKVVDLLSDDNPLGSPYNKATFLPMPFFTTEELGKLFSLYNEFFDEVFPIDIQSIIMRESFGHPASFMILLKLYHDFRTNSPIEWNRSLKENLENYLNWTHVKITRALRRMNSTDLAHVRDYTAVRNESWEVDLSNLSEIDKYLLNIGILVWPKPRKSLQIRDVKDPIFLLAHSLQNVTPATIINERVRNLHGPSEKAFQAAVYRVMNELLPISMNCLFEVRIRKHVALDLMVIQNNNNWCGYESNVEKISSAQFRDPVKQAKRYAEYFRMNIYLVNFHHDGGSTPTVVNIPEGVTLVNIKYNAECTKFTINTIDNEISVNVS